MGAANLLASSDQDVDFFIHGVFSYELFGQTFWITTTHVAIAIVMLLIVIFAVMQKSSGTTSAVFLFSSF